MAYTNKQVTGGMAIAAVAIAGGFALGVKVKRMLKARALKKTQVPVNIEGQAPEAVEVQPEVATPVVAIEKTAPLDSQA